MMESLEDSHHRCYYLLSAEDEKAVILAAMVNFHTYTCVRFVPADHAFVKAILVIEKLPGESGCKSYIGFNTPRLTFLNSANCLLHGIIQHELMHVLGFDHEHKRPDRDDFVKVHLENVVGKAYYDSFNKLPWSEVDETVKQTRYDYGSVMHYGWDAFSKGKSKLKTLEALDASALSVMGQRTSLSYSDIKKINVFYGCPEYRPEFAPSITDFGAPSNPFSCNFDQDWCGWRQQMSNLMPAYYKDSGESVPKWKAD
uniref:Metalloendopeptidase n=1 Tax=Plectus sambesii TaxID=2011161 RepID=A0A914UP75_9BILA